MHQVFVQLLRRLNEVNENVVEPAIRLSELAESGQGLLAREHLALIETLFEVMGKQLDAVGASDDPAELLARQTELAWEWTKQLQALSAAHLRSERKPQADPYISAVDDLTPARA